MRIALSTCLAFGLGGTMVSAHAWLYCTNWPDSDGMIAKMKEGESQNKVVDPTFAEYEASCLGYPRSKMNPKTWNEQGKGNNQWALEGDPANLAWPMKDKAFVNEKGACPPAQRAPKQEDGSPMAKSKAGGTIKLLYGGNGHARVVEGGPPGDVSVYWAGKKETEIASIDELTDDKKIATAGFAALGYSYPPGDDKDGSNGLIDKGQWMEVKLPGDMEAGRHMLVWVWSYGGENRWSSCFDVEIE